MLSSWQLVYQRIPNLGSLSIGSAVGSHDVFYFIIKSLLPMIRVMVTGQAGSGLSQVTEEANNLSAPSSPKGSKD